MRHNTELSCGLRPGAQRRDWRGACARKIRDKATVSSNVMLYGGQSTPMKRRSLFSTETLNRLKYILTEKPKIRFKNVINANTIPTIHLKIWLLRGRIEKNRLIPMIMEVNPARILVTVVATLSACSRLLISFSSRLRFLSVVVCS